MMLQNYIYFLIIVSLRVEVLKIMPLKVQFGYNLKFYLKSFHTVVFKSTFICF